MKAQEAEAMLSRMLEGCEDADEIWNGRVARDLVRRRYAEWLADLADWRCFVTLTFREDKHEESALKLFRLLIRELNRDLLGNHYTRYVKHSYFSYALATEFQSRGAVHFHWLADRPLHFRLIHELWNKWAGFALTEIVRSQGSAVWYVAKYITKNGIVEPWKSLDHPLPLVKPEWWKTGDRSAELVSESGIARELRPGGPTA